VSVLTATVSTSSVVSTVSVGLDTDSPPTGPRASVRSTRSHVTSLHTLTAAGTRHSLVTAVVAYLLPLSTLLPPENFGEN